MDDREVGAGNGKRSEKRVITGWSPEDVERLRLMAEAKAPMGAIARCLGRSEMAIRVKASRLGVDLPVPEARAKAERAPKQREAGGARSERGRGKSREPAWVRRAKRAQKKPERGFTTRELDAPSYLNPRYKAPAIGPARESTPESPADLSDMLEAARGSRRWRRFLLSLKEREIQDAAYAAATRAVRANLDQEIMEILLSHRYAFLADVAESFAHSIADEVVARDRQYRHAIDAASVELSRKLPDGRAKRDALDQIIASETDELLDWEKSIQLRLVETIDEALEWYRDNLGTFDLGDPAIKRYRERSQGGGTPEGAGEAKAVDGATGATALPPAEKKSA